MREYKIRMPDELREHSAPLLRRSWLWYIRLFVWTRITCISQEVLPITSLVSTEGPLEDSESLSSTRIWGKQCQRSRSLDKSIRVIKNTSWRSSRWRRDLRIRKILCMGSRFSAVRYNNHCAPCGVLQDGRKGSRLDKMAFPTFWKENDIATPDKLVDLLNKLETCDMATK